MKKIYLSLALILLSLAFVSAESSFIFKQGSPFTLSVAMANNDLSTCSTCTCQYSIFYPNGSALFVNQAGTNNNGYCEIVNQTSIAGTYGAEMTFTNGADNGRVTFNFDVTPTGQSLTSAKATSYVIILIISILIFGGLLFMGIGIPNKNKSDAVTGYIIAVNNIKYLKFLFIGLAYVTLIWISYFSWMIVYAYLDFPFLTSIFQFMFYFLALLTVPLFILFCYINIANLVRDSQIKEYLERGLRVKE